MRLIAVFIVLFTTVVFAAEPASDMMEVVDSFYNTYLAVQPSGIPTAKEMENFNPYFTAGLVKLLQQADQAEQKYHEQTKGEVPPLVEGDLFTSLFEGATNFKVLLCEIKTGSCLVELSYVAQEKTSSPTIWKDKVYLVKTARGWQIDDIEFLGEWQFMHRGRLQDLLEQVVMEGNND